MHHRSFSFLISLIADASVTLPLAMGIILWIGFSDRKLALQWTLGIGMAIVAVVLSKLYWAVFHLQISAIAFRMLSGHMALAFAIWPPFFMLIAGAFIPRATTIGRILGLVFCFVIGCSRLFGAHTLSEVVMGSFVGLLVEVIFAGRISKVSSALPYPRVIVACLVFVIFFQYGAVTQDGKWIDEFALKMSSIYLDAVSQ